MLKKLNLFIFVLALILTTSCSHNKTEEEIGKLDWHEKEHPTNNQPQTYGSYTAGCINGAIKLAEKGTGYKNTSALNERNYAHESLINAITKLSESTHAKYGANLLIGDLSHARGGPASIKTSAHRSHQNGLDADIWYKTVPDDFVVNSAITAQSVLTRSGRSISRKHWKTINSDIIRSAARYQNVERILVNPAIKKQLCKEYKNAKWLRKVRPWWGHSKHFHLRMSCPKSNKHCKKQDPTPNKSGCGAELDWWFSEEAANMGKEKSATKRKSPKLPQQCQSVFYSN